MNPHDDITGDDWTPDERELFASLPRERIPSRRLKKRTLEAVRQLPSAAPRLAPRPGYLWLLGAVAAVSIFVAGTLVGYAAARRTTPSSGASRVESHDAVASAKRDTTTTNQMRYVVWY